MKFDEPLTDSYEEIVESFTSNQYFGVVHSFETPLEGMESYYFIELKPLFPNNQHVQFAVLWRLLEHSESHHNYQLTDIRELNDRYRENFQYILESWNPKPIKDSDIKRIKEILIECKEAIFNSKRIKGSRSTRKFGYYLNNNFKGKELPIEVKNRIMKSTSGFVIESDWNYFTVVLEYKRVYSMFHWSTGA